VSIALVCQLRQQRVRYPESVPKLPEELTLLSEEMAAELHLGDWMLTLQRMFQYSWLRDI
jgi:hypothetical protein